MKVYVPPSTEDESYLPYKKEESERHENRPTTEVGTTEVAATGTRKIAEDSESALVTFFYCASCGAAGVRRNFSRIAIGRQ